MQDIGVIVDAAKTELAVQSLTEEDCIAHPIYGRFGRRYYPAAVGSTWNDASFAVYRGDRPVAAAICGSNGGPICYYGMPMRIWVDKTLGVRNLKTVLRKSLDHLASFGRANGTSSCVICDDPPGASASFLGRSLHAAGAVPRLDLHGRVELEPPQAAIVANVRKSYRSLINWGKRHIILSYVNRDNPDLGMFDRYRYFHRRISGRVTRSQESWDIMFETIADGSGELSLGHDDAGSLLSATLTIDGGSVAQYSSGVYDRDRFDKPIGHWPVLDAILRAKARGMSLFDLGEIPVMETASEKEVSIGRFKRGFAGRLDFQLAWEMQFDLQRGAD